MASLNIFQKFGNAVAAYKGATEDRNTPLNSDWIKGINYSESEINVNSSVALTLSAVWNANLQISQDIATFTIKLFKKEKGDKVEILDHPALMLLNYQPNPSMTAQTFRRSLVSQYNMRGNGLALIKNMPRGKKELILLNPDATQPKISSRGNKFFDSFDYLGREYKAIPNYKVLHNPNFSFNGYWGTDVITNFRDMLGLAKAQEKYNSSYYANSASANAVLKIPNTLKEGDGNRYREEFKKHSKNGLVVVGAGMEYQSISITPEHSQFLQSRIFQVEEIARMFNIPLHKIKSLKDATNNNIEQQSKEYYQDTLQPIIIQMENEYKKLLTENEIEQGYFFEHDMDEILRADIKTRYDAYGVASVHKFMKRNEIRAKEGLSPLKNNEEDFNDFQSPANSAK